MIILIRRRWACLKPRTGFINIGVGGDGQWRALCVALERPDLGMAPEYTTLELRFRNRPS